MKTVAEILSKYCGKGQDELIPILQEIQNEQAYLSKEAMESVAQALGVSVCHVYGVASFYNQFRFSPLGKNIIEVCRGTACHVKGSKPIADYLTRHLKINQEGNSPDQKFTLITVACLGACSIAPVMRMNGEFYGHLTPERIDQILKEVAL